MAASFGRTRLLMGRFPRSHDYTLWGSLASCARVGNRRFRRVANPPQVDNLPHKSGSCRVSPMRLSTLFLLAAAAWLSAQTPDAPAVSGRARALHASALVFDGHIH